MNPTSNAPQHPTIPAPPKVDFDGNKIEDDVLFFKFPTGIGALISGHSDLPKAKKPLTAKERLFNSFLGLVVGAIVGLIIYLAFKPMAIGYVVAAFAGPMLLSLLMAIGLSTYMGYNFYVGRDGFALYRCLNTADNIPEDLELRFSDVTDVHYSTVEVYENGLYKRTSFTYTWIDRRTNRKVHKEEGDFHRDKTRREYEPRHKFAIASEIRWTQYLIENMNAELQSKGYVSFHLANTLGSKNPEFIRLAKGSITFVKGKGEEFTYHVGDIQQITYANNLLRIKHKNFERVLLLFKKGNEDNIPLDALCNLKFFLFAFEKLMGYKL